MARVQLRRKFIAADMGVSGCNFAVAENGAVSTVTNEGNARMVTTLRVCMWPLPVWTN